MKILLLCDDMECGGAQTHVCELARQLLRRGHEVCVASGGGRLAEEIEREGVRQEMLDTAHRSPASLLRARRRLRELIGEGFDLVHAHTRMSAFLASPICASLGVCMVTTVHARFSTGNLKGRLSRWGDGAVAVSDDLYFYMLENAPHLSPESLFIIKNGIDTEVFSPAKIADGEGRGRRLLFLSRLDADCSSLAYSLCRIAERLYRKYPDVRIVIGGGGSEYARICELADELEGRLGVRVVEPCGRVCDTPEFFRSGDAFIGVSRAALEAMACGLPTIIAGDEGFIGIADEKNIRRGAYGNFCCRGERKADDGALFFEISRLFDMPRKQRDALGEYSRRYVCRHHSAERMAELTERAYLRINENYQRKKRRGGTLLCGYYGYGNLGDELMLRASARRAEEGGEQAFALTKRGGRDSRSASVCCVCRRHPMAVIRAVRRSERVIFGGGTLLQNDTSRRSLMYYLCILRLAQTCKKRTELWGNGIGEIRGKLSRRAVARALSRCDYVGLRDRCSAVRLEKILCESGYGVPSVCVEGELVMSGPMSEWLMSGESDALLRIGFDGGERFFVALISGRGDKSAAAALIRFCKRLAGRGITPVFAVMYPSEDLRRTRRAAELVGGVMAYPLGVRDLATIIDRAELVCSMRYHALVLASLAGKAFIGFGGEGDDKSRAFCLSHGGVFFSPTENDGK